MYHAALIDLDGFLINSEPLYLEANQQYFKKHHNFSFTQEHHRQITGKKFEKWITTVVPTDKSGEVVLQERNVIFFDLVRRKLKLVTGAREFLIRVHEQFKTALVTSSRKDYVDLVFEKNMLAQYFDVLVTGDMILHGKPDPEPYLFAAKKLAFSPSDCLVFEDAPSGVLAGKNAGMTVIAVPSEYVKGDEGFKKADYIFSSLKEITLDKFTA